MKRVILLLLFSMSLSVNAQTEESLLNHYKAYYTQMRLQGDVNGVISALTHLNIIAPEKARQDTLAYVYMNNNQHLQALNTVGIERNESDSDLAVQVKAISLKALNQPKRALEQFQLLFGRSPNPYLAYEIADLKIQVGDNAGAVADIDYGIANTTDEMKYAFYERQQPYEVSLKGAFTHLKGLVQYNTDKDNINEAIATIDQALEMDPNFNLASLSKQALQSRKDSGDEPQN